MKALDAAALGLHWSDLMVMLYYGFIMAILWLYSGCCYSCFTSQERVCVMAAMPARRE